MSNLVLPVNAFMADTETRWRFEVDIEQDQTVTQETVVATFPDMLQIKIPELSREGRVLGMRWLL